MSNLKEQIKDNQNAYGGGLAKEVTGLYESNRNALAKCNKKKRTAGQVAQSLRKKKHKIFARDIKVFFEEWHHAGFYNKKMARTYYTKKTDDEILQEFQKLKMENSIKQRKVISGFYWIWDYDYSGSYGRKINFKVVDYGKFNLLSVPRNFTKCTRKTFEKNMCVGDKFYGWDEPTI